MLNFYHKEKKVFVTTSFKVMFSTLSDQPSLKRLRFFQMFFQRFIGSIFFSHSKHYLLVRNPYHRLESFFKNKFRSTFLNAESNYRWQDNQKIFFQVLKLNEEMSFEEKKQAFLATSFTTFLKLLPEVYKKDPHLHPQHFNSNFYRISLLTLNYDKVIKIEDVKSLEALSEELDLNLIKRHNSTLAVSEELIWDTPSLEIVNQIYSKDFQRYDYKSRI